MRRVWLPCRRLQWHASCAERVQNYNNHVSAFFLSHSFPNTFKLCQLCCSFFRYSPDFSLARSHRLLTIHTSLSQTVTYHLQAFVPPHLLSKCAAALPRPPWESLFYYSTVTLMTFLLAAIMATAYLEFARLEDVHRRKRDFAEFTSDCRKVFDLNNLDSGMSNMVEIQAAGDGSQKANGVLPSNQNNNHHLHSQQKSQQQQHSADLHRNSTTTTAKKPDSTNQPSSTNTSKHATPHQAAQMATSRERPTVSRTRRREQATFSPIAALVKVLRFIPRLLPRLPRVDWSYFTRKTPAQNNTNPATTTKRNHDSSATNTNNTSKKREKDTKTTKHDDHNKTPEQTSDTNHSSRAHMASIGDASEHKRSRSKRGTSSTPTTVTTSNTSGKFPDLIEDVVSRSGDGKRAKLSNDAKHHNSNKTLERKSSIASESTTLFETKRKFKAYDESRIC